MLVRSARGRQWTWNHGAAAGAVVIGAAASLIVAPNAQGLFGAGLAMLMIAIAAIDSRHFIIPDELNIAAFILALANAGFQNNNTVVEDIALAILRGGALSLAFLGLQHAYRALRKRDGIGLGDVKLAAVAGAWLGWQTIPIAVEIAALGALAAYAAHHYFSGRTFRATTRLPFGLFFAPAIWLAWLLETLNLFDALTALQFLAGGRKI